MALTPEWRGRVELWRNTLERLCYRKLADVPLRGFTTREQLTPAQALRRTFRPMPPGTPWGAKWEYAWFQAAVRLPAEARGRRILLRTGEPREFTIDPGAEGRVLVNGREAGGRDWAHPDITLTTNGQPGRVFAILIEAYAGHGPILVSRGPALDGVPPAPEPPARQQRVFPSSIGIWREEIYQAWLDVQTLFDVRDNLDPDSLRVAAIDAALRDFVCRADLELPPAAAEESARLARRALRPALAARNGSTAPRFYCHGHAHIDVAWLWPLAETERKCARTFATQLALMAQYPEYKFFQSQPHLYWMTRRRYPGLYARIKAAARRGQWLPEGGMWVEADTNVSGGESLIRQFLHGKRFLREEFGIESELLWLPDVFGYSGALPQIMAGCGIKYFSTQKIFWGYNGGEPFPYNTFWWEGIDGTRVFSHFHNNYNSPTNPAVLMRRWAERVQKDGIAARLVPFGWGDGGGGATRTHLEYLRRQRDLEGTPRCRLAGPLEFFRDEVKNGARLPVYVGELYFQAHRGTYTTQARTKRGNRQCEIRLREAELWGTAAAALAGYRYPASALRAAWQDVLLNQFHDILPGSSIRRVYEEAESLHARALAAAENNANAAQRALTRKTPGALTVFNSLSWPRRALVPLPRGASGAQRNGAALPGQRIGGVMHVEVEVPACGWRALQRTPQPAARAGTAVAATPALLENEHLRLRFNARGEIVSCRDKATGREWAAGPLNSFRLYRDIPRAWDAWDLDSTYKTQPVPLAGAAEIRVVAAGPLAGVLRVRRTLNRSRLEQEIRLRRDSRRVEFRTRLEWRETNKLLKVNFPTTLQANEAIHEVQFGHLRRPNHASRVFDADRFEVCQQKWTALAEENRGAAVLNDCKYGVNVEGGSLNLSLLRAPTAPDAAADRGPQEFAYAFFAWNGPFFESAVVREAYELNVPVRLLEGFAGEGALFEVDAPNVLIEAVKAAEDGSGDVVVRLYEAKRTATSCALRCGLPVRQARVCGMLEDGGKALAVNAGKLKLDFRPFEIKTLRLSVKRETNRISAL